MKKNNNTRGRSVVEHFQRTAGIRSVDVDEENRRATVAFSSEAPVFDRSFGPPIVLLHEIDSVDMSTIRDIGSVLVGHDEDRIVGRPENIEIGPDRIARATIVFDDDAESEATFRKVVSGSLRGISVRYHAKRFVSVNNNEEYVSTGGMRFEGPLDIATEWEPREISLTPIPADTSVGVGRVQTEESLMTENKDQVTGDDNVMSENQISNKEDSERGSSGIILPLNVKSETDDVKYSAPDMVKVDDVRSEESLSLDSARVSGEEQEKNRVKVLMDIEKQIGGNRDLLTSWINDGVGELEAREQAMEFMADKNKSVTSPSVEVSDSSRDMIREGLSNALLERAGTKHDADKFHDVPRGLGPLATARFALRAAGVQGAEWMTADQVATRALTLGESDFPAIVENSISKSLHVGFEEAPTTYEKWTVAESRSDFKSASRVKVGELDNFQETPDLMPIPEGSFSDAKETYQLSTFAQRIGFGRQAIINDDMGVFSNVSKQLGEAAARTINANAYKILIANATMNEDSVALFGAHASGTNLAGSGAVISATTLQAGRKTMALTTGLNGAALNIEPSFLLFPPSIEQAAMQIVHDNFMATQASNSNLSWIPSVELVRDAALETLTGGSSTAWYLVSSPSRIDTVVVATLNGQTSPTLTPTEGGNILGLEWVAYIDSAAKAVEHRGMYKNPGA